MKGAQEGGILCATVYAMTAGHAESAFVAALQ